MTSPSRPATPDDIEELVDAYIAWDRSCKIISDRAQTAVDLAKATGERPRLPKVGGLTLAAETERLQRIERRLRLRVDWDKPIRTLRQQMPLPLALYMVAGKILGVEALHRPSDHDHHEDDQQQH